MTGLPERFIPRAASIEVAAKDMKVDASPKRKGLQVGDLDHPAKRAKSAENFSLDDRLVGASARPGAELAISRRTSREEIHLKRRVVLTTHPAQYSASPTGIVWGASTPEARGPVIGTQLALEPSTAFHDLPLPSQLTLEPSTAFHGPRLTFLGHPPTFDGLSPGTLLKPELRNAIGTHNGPYAIYRAVSAAKGGWDPSKRSDLAYTEPTVKIGPYPSWYVLTHY